MMDTMDKKMIYILGWTEQDSVRFYYATKNGVQFITYELFISGTFH